MDARLVVYLHRHRVTVGQKKTKRIADGGGRHTKKRRGKSRRSVRLLFIRRAEGVEASSAGLQLITQHARPLSAPAADAARSPSRGIKSAVTNQTPGSFFSCPSRGHTITPASSQYKRRRYVCCSPLSAHRTVSMEWGQQQKKRKRSKTVRLFFFYVQRPVIFRPPQDLFMAGDKRYDGNHLKMNKSDPVNQSAAECGERFDLHLIHFFIFFRQDRSEC